MRFSIHLYILSFILGCTANNAFPTKNDKMLKQMDYAVACFDGQLDVVDAIANKRDIKDCSEMAKSRVK